MRNQWIGVARTTLLVGVLLACPTVHARRRALPQRALSSASRDSLVKILTAENQRNGKDPYLAVAIHHPTPAIRQAALFAIARIGEASVIGEVSELLNKRHNPGKEEAIFALGLIPDESALTIAVQHLAMQQDPQVLADLYVSIGRGGNEKSVPLFAKALQSAANPVVLEGACLGLGLLWAKDSEGWAVPAGLQSLLLQRMKQNDSLALACSFALSRFKGLPTQIPPMEAVKTAEQVKSREALALLLRVVGKINGPAATTLLLQKSAPFSTPAVRIEALDALGSHPVSKPILASLRSALEAPESAVVYQALESLQGYASDAKEVSPAVLALYRKTPSLWIQSKALRVGMVSDTGLWKPLVLKEINEPKSSLRSAAAAALALAPTVEDGPLLATLLKDSNVRVVTELLESMAGWPAAAFNEDIKATLRANLERKDPAISAGVALIVEKLKWKDFGSALATAYQGLNKPDSVGSRVTVLTAMGSLGDSSLAPYIETLLKDPDKTVVTAAVEALREISGRDESAKIPLNSKSEPFPFTGSDIDEAAKCQVVLKTTRGEIQIKMAKEAPLNAVHFLRLVRRHFYDGLIFHRVVPNFVAQGGDPRGDGFGGPGYLVRDEVSPRRHARGTVGLATTGKDTGGSQFFINLSPNLHLDGRYTLFGEVTRGMEVADKLEGGDKILSARVLNYP
jgi:cyclophilin family peptidyl-prolyl cis-trans isomerase/HEAT repeat protein